jgi:outer membrane receptor protein involved in Fe transport
VSRWAGTEVNVTHDWLRDQRFVTLLGVDGRVRHVTSWASYRDDVTGATDVVAPYDEVGWAVGAYVQQTALPAPWLSLNLGVRFDRDEVMAGHLSPRAAVVVPAWAGGTVKAIFAEAFRAPTYYERFYGDDVYWVAPQRLGREHVRSVEGAVEQRLGAQRLRLAFFRSWFTDLVRAETLSDGEMAAAVGRGVLSPDAQSGTVQQYRNTASVDSYGLHAAWDGSGRGRRLRYGAALTLARARADGDERLAAAAQVFGNVHGSYDLGAGLPTLALAARFAGPRPVSQSSLSPVPDARAVVELHGALTGHLARGVSLGLSATYAFADAAAYAVGPAKDRLLPAPQLRALAGLRYDQP